MPCWAQTVQGCHCADIGPVAASCRFAHGWYTRDTRLPRPEQVPGGVTLQVDTAYVLNSLASAHSFVNMVALRDVGDVEALLDACTAAATAKTALPSVHSGNMRTCAHSPTGWRDLRGSAPRLART
jgi:hypothetical protein